MWPRKPSALSPKTVPHDFGDSKLPLLPGALLNALVTAELFLQSLDIDINPTHQHVLLTENHGFCHLTLETLHLISCEKNQKRNNAHLSNFKLGLQVTLISFGED